MKKSLLIGSACLAIQVVPAFAADLRVKALPVLLPAGSWTGLHVGGQVGAVASTFTTGSYDWNGNFFDFTGGDATQTFAGINLGYNRQFDRAVLGIEGDINLKAGHGFYAPLNLRITSDWDASLRAKAGVLVTPLTLLYATGGLAFTSFGTSPADSATGVGNGASDFLTGPDLGSSRVGWTIGGGAEYALDSVWSTKLEYRYTDYGSKSAGMGLPEVKYTDERIVFGLNYNTSPLPTANRPSTASRALKAPISTSWTGWYVGGQIGVVSANLSVSTPSNIGDYNGPYTASGSFFQTLAGLHAGYDFQTAGRFLVGAEGDINAKWGAGTLDLQSTKSRPQSDYDGSIRARFGYLITPQSLAYVTGGFAFGHFTTPFHENEYIFGPNPGDVADVLGGMRYGWTLGGGLQQQLDSNWSARIEARYTDWGTKNVTWDADDGSPPANSKLTDFRVLSGMSYKFGARQFAQRDTLRPNWNGPYAGIQVGSISAKNQFGHTGGDTNCSNCAGGDAEEYNDFTTPFVGLHAGYNVVVPSTLPVGILIGAEGDLNHKFGHGFGIDDVLRYTSAWDASIRGRVGVMPTARSLLYFTGGYAWGDFTSPSTGADCCDSGDYNQNHVGGRSRSGWTYGGGIEYALDENMKTRMEYRHTNWGSKIGYDFDQIFPSYLSDDRVSLGLTYSLSSFNSGPVVAKY